MRSSSNYSGFTIVELLIVVVVIAILASISVTTYSGIQHKAFNAAKISEVRKMNNLIKQYLVINGATAFRALMPISNYFCLGEGYKDIDPGIGSSCYVYQDTFDNVPSYNRSLPTLDNALKQLGDYSTASMSPVEDAGWWTSSGNTYTWTERTTAPVAYRFGPNQYVDGAQGFAMIYYALKGIDVDCGLRPLVNFASYTNGIYNYTVNHDDRNSGVNDNVTWCNAYIPES